MKSVKVLVYSLILCVFGCSATLPTYNVKFSGNTITVPVNNFTDTNINIVNDDTAPYDILLVKESPLGYYSILLKCSFDEKPLDPVADMIICPVCGSIYNVDGTVKNGPAESPLPKFQTELGADQQYVTINIEALNR